MLICPGCRTEYHEQLEVCPKDGLPLIVRSSAAEPVAQPHATETGLSAGLMVGEFRIEAPIVDGEMGTTYAAIHPLIRKRVAIRVLHGRYAQDHRAVSRFVMEARAVNEIGHHNIVDILSIGELWDGRNYLVMELIDGEDLRQILRRTGRLDTGSVLALFEQLCDALEAVHRAGFIHRDLRPENVVVLRRPPHPFVKIQDFGLAMLKGDDGEDDVATLVGTPVYMAPELSRGSDVDFRADLYSLGTILYELLTGQPPFSAQTLFHAFTGDQKLSPRPPAELAPIDPRLEAAVLQALAWDPDRRQGSANQLLRALRRSISDPPTWTVAPAPQRPSARPGRTPPPRREVEVPAPESIVGDVEDDELEVTDGKAVVIVPSRTVLGHVAPQMLDPERAAADGDLRDEEPTDIYTGKPPAPAARRRARSALREKIDRLKPDALLDEVPTSELVENDTQLSEPSFGSHEAEGEEAGVPEAGEAPAEETIIEATRPTDVELPMIPESAEDDPLTATPEGSGETPYCSIEIVGEAGEENSK